MTSGTGSGPKDSSRTYRRSFAGVPRSLPLPVTVRRDCPAEGALGLSGSEIRVGLQRRAEDWPDVLRFGGGSPEPGEALVEVTDDQIAGALGTVTRAVLHLDSGYDPGPSGDQIAVDAYVMVALAFENVGQDDIAGTPCGCVLC